MRQKDGTEFALLEDTVYWRGSKQPFQDLGFTTDDHETNFKVIYQAFLGTWQDKLKEWPDTWDRNDWIYFFEALQAEIERDVPADFSGVLLFDFEAFPVTLFDPHGGPDYQAKREARLNAILNDSRYNPDGTLTREDARYYAEELYHPSSRLFWGGVYALTKALRPSALVGFYGTWRSDSTKGMLDYVRASNLCSQWLYNLVDVFAPTAYLGSNAHNPDPTLPGTFCDRGVLNCWIDEWQMHMEWKRNVTGREPIVLPFMSVGYGGSSKWVDLMPSDTYARAVEQVASGGMSGLILWYAVYADRPEKLSQDDYEAVLNSTVRDGLCHAGVGNPDNCGSGTTSIPGATSAK